ncbi:MAG: hypothetical protein RJQ08_13620 [Salinisphaeraceae bacterium]
MKRTAYAIGALLAVACLIFPPWNLVDSAGVVRSEGYGWIFDGTPHVAAHEEIGQTEKLDVSGLTPLETEPRDWMAVDLSRLLVQLLAIAIATAGAVAVSRRR